MQKQIIISNDGRVIREAVLLDDEVLLLRSKVHHDPNEGDWMEPTDELRLTWGEFNRIADERQAELTRTQYKPAPPMSHKFHKGDRATLVIPDDAPAQQRVTLPFAIAAHAADGHKFVITDSVPVYDDVIGEWRWGAQMIDLPFWGVLPENWLQPA